MTGRTAQAVRQTRPFSGLEEETFVAVQRLATLLLQEVADVLRPAGLTPTQYNVLRILGGAAPDGLSCGEISDRLVTRDPDMTRLLNRLMKRRLVKRERQEADQRVVVNRITPAGVALLASLREPIEDLHRRRLGPLGADRLRRLAQLAEQAADLRQAAASAG